MVLPRPALAPADWANAQHPHNKSVLVSKSILRVMVHPPLLEIEMAASYCPMGHQVPDALTQEESSYPKAPSNSCLSLFCYQGLVTIRLVTSGCNVRTLQIDSRITLTEH